MSPRESHFVIIFVVVLLLVHLPASAKHPSYAFSLDRVNDGVVHFRGDNNCPWSSTSFGGGPFFVSQEGVTNAYTTDTLDVTAGIMVELSASQDSINITCLARRCRISKSAAPDTKWRKLRNGRAASVPVTSGIVFRVVE